MTVYAGTYAALYDLFYAEKPYGAEAAFVDAILRRHESGPGRRLLDVACGTGRHALALSALGWTVVGVDQSPDMLDEARRRAGDSGATFEQQDMRALDLAGPPFDAVTCLFDSIGYGLTNEGVLAALRGIALHLRPQGLAMIEFWHAPAMIAQHDPLRERAWETEAGRVERTSRTTLDVAAAAATVEYEVRGFPHAPAEPWVLHESHANRYFLVPEMELFLDVAGFDAVAWFGGFADPSSIGEGTWHVVALARRR